jgi:hypothetical protein
MIHVSIDSNEAMRPRAELIRKAITSDPHFKEIPPVEPMPFDLEFWSEGDITKALHIEIKDFGQNNGSDYLSSILSGHLWEQCQAAREIGEPFIIAVLGDDHDIQAAIRAAAGEGRKGGNGKRGKPACFDVDKFAQYSALVDGFEANCEGCQIRVIKLGYNQYPRLLLRARKVLEGGDLSGFCPKPAEKERMEVGLSILAGRGVGPKMAANILKRYNLCLIRRDGYCGDLEDIPGIGPKRAETIKRNIEVMD